MLISVQFLHLIKRYCHLALTLTFIRMSSDLLCVNDGRVINSFSDL